MYINYALMFKINYKNTHTHMLIVLEFNIIKRDHLNHYNMQFYVMASHHVGTNVNKN